jgi:DNA-binding transcriptional regulator GbsR (MarR family)
MHESVQQFVERMGLHLEAEGLPRSAGRIFGYLLLAEHPCSLDDLVETLQVSKGSVSTNARLLEQSGLLERTSEPGDRRDFYQLHSDAWERMLLVARRRWEGMYTLLSAAADAVPCDLQHGKQRLCEAKRFHELLLDESDTLIERWRVEQANPILGGLMVVGVDEGVAAG